MVAAARTSGVVLVPISGSAKSQEQLFFDIKAARGQSGNKRATVSAPLVIANITLVMPWTSEMEQYQQPEYYI